MTIIIIVIVAICGVFLLVVYNRLVRLVNYVREAWAASMSSLRNVMI